MSAAPELFYFDGRGKAEVIRLTLAASNIKFSETDLATRDAFLNLMPELPFGQVPLLKIDGLKLVQTSAILRYIGRKANLLGTNDAEMFKVDMLFEGTRDAYGKFLGFGFQPEEAVKEAINPVLDKYLPIYNKALADNGSTGYLVGSKLTLADLGLFEVIQATVDYFGEDRLKDYAEIQKFYKTVTSLGSIQSYLKEIRKRKNDERYCKEVALALGWSK